MAPNERLSQAVVTSGMGSDMILKVLVVSYSCVIYIYVKLFTIVGLNTL